MLHNYMKIDLLQYKSLETNGEFFGYACTFNNQDDVGDIILPGAFAETIRSQSHLVLLWQHDQKEPIGYITKFKEDLIGLYIKKFIMQLKRAAYALIAAGVIKGLSTDYLIEDYFHDGTIRYIKKIKLIEISVVTFPANRQAMIEDVKLNHKYLKLLSSIKRALNTLAINKEIINI
ncbi:phage prohead protease [Reticulomyxa filosa]|uniref:Phage prohead protease n=1 Tax=Reticulomyxa filosa TaxID=46433 RepID=X6MRY7_RETFI|nr:phage prohead protease [Reticulomyxa filosa]|eukprot:ETO16227.1 phage prohead protease [Reticulomyxa filosa]